MKLDKDKIKESLTEDEVIKILTELGSSHPLKDNQGNLIFSTICHGGSNHKLYYFPSSYNFYCFTECNENRDIYQLVIDAKATQGYNFTFPQAIRYVAEITGRRIVTEKPKGFGLESSKIDDWEWINKITKRKPEMTEKLPMFNESILDVFMPYQNNWWDEGITIETANKYEVGYYFSRNQIIFVNRDKEGRLIGIRSRNLDKELVDSGMKYIPTIANGKEYRFASNFNLYGMYQNKNNIKRLRKCLIFEGEKSVLKSEDMYKDNNFTVAVYGSNISSWQKDEILKLGVEEVFIAFDKFRDKKENESDVVYETHLNNYKNKLLRIANMFTPYAKTYVIYDDFNLLSEKDAPCDKGKEVFEQLMKRKYEIKTYDIEG